MPGDAGAYQILCGNQPHLSIWTQLLGCKLEVSCILPQHQPHLFFLLREGSREWSSNLLTTDLFCSPVIVSKINNKNKNLSIFFVAIERMQNRLIRYFFLSANLKFSNHPTVRKLWRHRLGFQFFLLKFSSWTKKSALWFSRVFLWAHSRQAQGCYLSLLPAAPFRAHFAPFFFHATVSSFEKATVCQAANSVQIYALIFPEERKQCRSSAMLIISDSIFFFLTASFEIGRSPPRNQHVACKSLHQGQVPVSSSLGPQRYLRPMCIGYNTVAIYCSPACCLNCSGLKVLFARLLQRS